MKNEGITSEIKIHFRGKHEISTQELANFIRSKEGDIPEKTIAWQIYRLKEAGILKHIGRGTYTNDQKNKANFLPSISSQLKKIYSEIKKNLPYLSICIWDTRWLNSFMTHQMGRYYIIVEVEKDGMESVFNLLSDTHKNVFVNQDVQTIERYVGNFQESIIIKQLISEAPIIEAEKVDTTSIEKLLVDCLAETELLSAQQDELENIFRNTFEKYDINVNKAKRYARRRGRQPEFDKMLKKIFKTLAKS